MIEIPAFAALKASGPLGPFKISRRNVSEYDVQIKIEYCGVCHSDIHQVRDEWGGSIFPMVPGHEIVGTVTGTGLAVKKFKVGERVGVGCFVDSCRHCEPCRNGLEQYCEVGMVSTYNAHEKDGITPTYGGYSTQIVVDENYVLKIPEDILPEEAAPLLCAGITTYSPLKHWRAGLGKKVAVLGFGGLGHMAVKMAHAMKAEVSVLSHSPHKKEDALRLGGDFFYDTNDPQIFVENANRFDLILATVSVELDWNRYLELLKLDGTLVLLGIPPTSPAVQAFSLIAKRRSLAGSLIGGIKETQEMLDFCAENEIGAEVELINIQDINKAYEQMLKGDVHYRFVIDMKSLEEP